ncbi:MAG: ABC transporter permease [Coriobacteriia bacterium]|nr:ABC transporter permease [Coriobacteriia bacterium]MCL2870080.1 ABC transporter permease [Coriobacteriia bacterium]
MNEIVVLNLWQFSLVYLLLIVVLAIMKKCQINQTKLLFVASLRMTVQLVLAGLILTFIFENPHPLFTVLYLAAMTAFAIYTILSRNKEINKRFKVIVAVSLAGTGLSIVVFFIMAVVGVSLFNPQYTIPLSGMIIGNAMTGVGLGLRSFRENLSAQRNRTEALLSIGVSPPKALTPLVNESLETALMPTLHAMIGMGIISLPGLMTGQILSGVMPMTSIMYQIAIIIAITAVTSLAVFCSLHFGYKTLYNKRQQMTY